MSKETSSKFFLIQSVTLSPTSSFIKQNLLPELLEMNVQTPLPNTKPAMELFSLLKQPLALQALVATPFLMVAGKLLIKELINKDLELKLPNMAPD